MRKHHPGLGFIVRVVLLLLAVLATSLLFVPARALAEQQPAFQETQYPYPPFQTVDPNVNNPPGGTYPYPAPNATPFPTFTLPPGVENTPTMPPLPVTPSPDVFRTEDAEMSGAMVTPLVTDSPGPTITPAPTQTSILTSTAVVATAGMDRPGWKIDWGFFWVGFALPFLVGCGLVLYLLDRRPDLFRR